MLDEEHGAERDDLEQLGRHFAAEVFAAQVPLERLVIQYATEGLLMLTVTERGEAERETICVERAV